MDSRPAGITDYFAATQIIHQSSGCVIAVWQDISIGIWRRSATLPLVLELENVRDHISKRYPKTSSIHVIVDDAGLPEPDARAKLEEITTASEARLIAVATVLTGSGFRTSAIRGFLTSVHWLKRRPYHARVCGSIREAVEWLAPLHAACSVATDPSALEHLIVQLCERPSVT